MHIVHTIKGLKNQILWYNSFQIKCDVCCLSINILHGQWHKNQPVWDHRSTGNWVSPFAYILLPNTHITKNKQQNVFTVSNHRLILFSGSGCQEGEGSHIWCHFINCISSSETEAQNSYHDFQQKLKDQGDFNAFQVG